MAGNAEAFRPSDQNNESGNSPDERRGRSGFGTPRTDSEYRRGSESSGETRGDIIEFPQKARTEEETNREMQAELTKFTALREMNSTACDRLSKVVGSENAGSGILQKLGEKLKDCASEKAHEVRAKFEFLFRDPKNALLLAAMEAETELLPLADMLLSTNAILPMLDMAVHAMAHGTAAEKGKAVALDLADDAFAFVHKIDLKSLVLQGNALVNKFMGFISA